MKSIFSLRSAYREYVQQHIDFGWLPSAVMGFREWFDYTGQSQD
jgi:hypothetical protein